MKPFLFSFIVPANMVDSLGHVHYRHFRDISELAQEDLLRTLGLNIEQVIQKGFVLFMREDPGQYRGELFEGDSIEVETTYEPWLEVGILFHARLKKMGKLVARFDYKMVVVTYPARQQVRVYDSPFQALFA